MRRFSLSFLPQNTFCTYAQWDYTNELPSESHWHWHDFHELFWVEEGEGTHWINGQSFPLRTGDLMLIRASDRHTFSAAQKNRRMRIVNFAFFAHMWAHIRKRYFKSASVFFSEPSVELRTYFLDSRQLDAIRQAAASLRSGQRDQLRAETFLLNVLDILQGNRHKHGTKSVPTWLRETCYAIGKKQDFSGGVPMLAKLAKRSQGHLAREFRRYLGRTPTDVLNDARMAYAAEKLVTSDDTILSITLDCGLENLSHFYRLFHARFGCAPRAYRMQQRRTLNLEHPFD